MSQPQVTICKPGFARGYVPQGSSGRIETLLDFLRPAKTETVYASNYHSKVCPVRRRSEKKVLK